MTDLSLENRNQILEEVHGIVSTHKNETPELIRTSLTLLDAEFHELMSSLKNGHGGNNNHNAAAASAAHNNDHNYGNDLSSFELQDDQRRMLAFQMAYTQDKSHVDSLRLMFLRSEVFHVKNTAAKMVAYFEEKLRVFGPELLVKDITIDDLSPGEDLECLESGYLSILPSRDLSGRPILCTLADRAEPTFSLESRVSYFVYSAFTMLFVVLAVTTIYRSTVFSLTYFPCLLFFLLVEPNL